MITLGITALAAITILSLADSALRLRSAWELFA